MYAGAIANLVFLTLHTWLGYGSFLVFAAIAFVGGVYCAIVVPETKGRTLAEVQALLAGDKGPAPDASAAGGVLGQMPFLPTASTPAIFMLQQMEGMCICCWCMPCCMDAAQKQPR